MFAFCSCFTFISKLYKALLYEIFREYSWVRKKIHASLWHHNQDTLFCSFTINMQLARIPNDFTVIWDIMMLILTGKVEIHQRFLKNCEYVTKRKKATIAFNSILFLSRAVFSVRAESSDLHSISFSWFNWALLARAWSSLVVSSEIRFFNCWVASSLLSAARLVDDNCSCWLSNFTWKLFKLAMNIVNIVKHRSRDS